MAALASTFFASTPKLSHSSTANSIPKFSLAKSLSHFNRPNLIAPIVVSALPTNCSDDSASELDSRNGLKKLVDSLFVLCASVALSASLFVADVDSASAFVVTTPRKLQSDELATVRLFQENTPSVVYITNLAARQDAFTLDVLEVPQGSGSGFVWDTDGHIVTNYHVIRGASDLKRVRGTHDLVMLMISKTLYLSVYLSMISGECLSEGAILDFLTNLELPVQGHSCRSEHIRCKSCWIDQDKDVAVLRIAAPKDKLRPIPIGVSADLLVGQKVYAIGIPFAAYQVCALSCMDESGQLSTFGLDHTLTTGVISGLRREISSAATGRPIQDVIQTDAAINPGNSGGPLLDSSGNLIGINTAIYSPSGASSGVGFSIPVDTSVEQLGVSGVLVLDAPANGPAGKAGLLPTKRDAYGRLILGDIITSVNGKKVTNGSDLYRILDQCKVGDKIIVEVLRGDHLEKIPVVLEPKPDET
ncbi:UNVERIFIED_CONTAM: Protease Do-like 1, chloroplastic [Sesamum latifolium]|uniref:Protease Do-like 1, chloroplastic n=1 Tax=Sesamum latifolium TaxID=2727402 RepID=A0AAW2Y7N4_9LAMI